jgi:hypothetical protein
VAWPQHKTGRKAGPKAGFFPAYQVDQWQRELLWGQRANLMGPHGTGQSRIRQANAAGTDTRPPEQPRVHELKSAADTATRHDDIPIGAMTANDLDAAAALVGRPAFDGAEGAAHHTAGIVATITIAITIEPLFVTKPAIAIAVAAVEILREGRRGRGQRKKSGEQKLFHGMSLYTDAF